MEKKPNSQTGRGKRKSWKEKNGDGAFMIIIIKYHTDLLPHRNNPHLRRACLQFLLQPRTPILQRCFRRCEIV